MIITYPKDQNNDPPQTQENIILHCNHKNADGSSAWNEIYNGVACHLCGLFYPDNGNYFMPSDGTEEVICKTCGAEIPNDGICWYCENNPENDCQ